MMAKQLFAEISNLCFEMPFVAFSCLPTDTTFIVSLPTSNGSVFHHCHFLPPELLVLVWHQARAVNELQSMAPHISSARGL